MISSILEIFQHSTGSSIKVLIVNLRNSQKKNKTDSRHSLKENYTPAYLHTHSIKTSTRYSKWHLQFSTANWIFSTWSISSCIFRLCSVSHVFFPLSRVLFEYCTLEISFNVLFLSQFSNQCWSIEEYSHHLPSSHLLSSSPLLLSSAPTLNPSPHIPILKLLN